MHVIDSGTGVPLVLLHAFPVDAALFQPLRALLEDHVRLITPDQRGCGQSPLDGSAGSTEASGEPTQKLLDSADLSVAARDALELLDLLELDQVVLGGCSMGGYVAMQLLRLAPERVSGLVLMNTRAGADNQQQRNARLLAADRALREGTHPWLADTQPPNLLGRTTHDRRPEVVRNLRAMVERQSAEGVAWCQRAMAAREDSTEVLRNFDRPALVIGGAEDTVIPPETVRELGALLPTAEVEILPETGHLAPLENPHTTADLMHAWLSRFS